MKLFFQIHPIVIISPINCFLKKLIPTALIISLDTDNYAWTVIIIIILNLTFILKKELRNFGISYLQFIAGEKYVQFSSE